MQWDRVPSTAANVSRRRDGVLRMRLIYSAEAASRKYLLYEVRIDDREMALGRAERITAEVANHASRGRRNRCDVGVETFRTDEREGANMGARKVLIQDRSRT